jgi:hypothetical protein
VPATPKRAGRQPLEPGARFLTDAIADNIRARRAIQRIPQETLAREMTNLGYPGWKSGVTVSEIEDGMRNVTANELIGLALLLNCGVTDLLDPTGIDGRSSEPVDLRFGDGLLGAVGVHHWLQRHVHVTTEGVDYIRTDPVEGHEAEYEETLKAFENAIRARSVESVPPPPRADIDPTKTRAQRRRAWTDKEN